MFDDAEFAKSVELGEENARVIELGTNHCRNMEFVEWGGGRGMLEEITGLPLNMRRIECPVAIGSSSAMNLSMIAFEFFAKHCIGCDQRNPTGRLPNLETEFEKRRAAAATAEAKRTERRRALAAQRTERVERRRGLRASSDPAAANILDDLNILDTNPEVDPDLDQQKSARQRLAAIAGRAHDRFSEAIVNELFDAVTTVGLVELIEPLRYVTAQRPELADRLVRTAITVLKSTASLEAGRCLTDHPTRVKTEDVDGALVRSVAVLAGSKTPSDHHMSGPAPVIAANDPGPVRVLADLVPDRVAATLGAMLPRPEAAGLIVSPVIRRPRPSDFDRRAAAGTIEQLASSHLELVIGLLPDVAISLGVPPDDRYDTGTVGSAERTLGRIFVEASARVAGLMEEAGRHASEDVRKGLVGAVRQGVDMTDRDYRFRRPQDPNLDDTAAQQVVDAAFTFFLALTDESWGHDVTFEACEAIERIGKHRADVLDSHIDATLGAFIALTRHRLEPPRQTLTTTGAPDPLAGLTQMGRNQSLFQAARRLLSAVVEAAATDPRQVCGTISAVIIAERDRDHGAEVITPLLETLGDIGRRYGTRAGVLQAILPALHTYLVDAEPGLRASALQAWVEIGSCNPVPSTVSDLLPALTTDGYLVVVNAVLAAATRLTWVDNEDRLELALYARHLVENIDLPERLDLFLDALTALQRHVPNLTTLAELEKQALGRLPELAWHQACKVIKHSWQPDARVAPGLAQQWLANAPHSTFGLRQHDEAEEALNGLLDCGIGLLGIPADNIIELGARHSPESHYGSVEYAEVLARVEDRIDAVKLLQVALDRVPDNQAHASQRTLINLALATGRLHSKLTTRDDNDTPTIEVADVQAAVDDLATVITTSQGFTGDDRTWLHRFELATATRAALTCDLLNLPYPPAIATTLTARYNPPEVAAASADPAADLTRRADNLRYYAHALPDPYRSVATATRRGLDITSRLLDCVAHLYEAEAADLNADPVQGQAHRTAAQRRATVIDFTGFRLDDPLVMRARELQTILATPNTIHDLTAITRFAAQLPAPLLFIRSPDRNRMRPWTPPADPEPDSPNVAVALVSIDDKLLTGPAIVDPRLTHTLTLQVQTDPWPTWATRLDAELISTLNDTELQRPAWTWTKNEHTTDPHTYEGTGSLHVRYSVPTAQHAPSVLVRLTWRGTDNDGNPHSQDLDVAGHREFRVRPYDPARDATTQYEVFDEHLLAIYENLAAAGYPHSQLQAFARLLNAVSRVGLAMTWNKKYRRGQHISERVFHNDLHNALLADPTLEGRVDRNNPLALGYLDTRHDGITAELKVARDQPVTPQTAPKYIGQPTQYAAADGTRLSILVILDMSRKTLPIGTPENYLFVLNPQQHGMTEPHSPSTVVTLIVNGNLPVPSSWSRRKTPTR